MRSRFRFRSLLTLCMLGSGLAVLGCLGGEEAPASGEAVQAEGGAATAGEESREAAPEASEPDASEQDEVGRSSQAATAAAYQGYGASTKGGSGRALISVTSLADSGPGSLREALAGGSRTVVFTVAGTIALKSALFLSGVSFLTLDGLSAPSPGITLTGSPLFVSGSHDLILRGLRIRDSNYDAITLVDGTYNVVIDHCSLANSGDENLGITEGVHDVTVSWSLLGASRPDWYALQGKGILISNFNAGPVTKVSLHHNLFVQQYQRSPQASTLGLFDIRSNYLDEWGAYGMRLRAGAYGNIVGNVFESTLNAKKAVLLNTGLPDASGSVYLAGNVSPAGVDVNALTMRSRAYSTPSVTATSTGSLASVLSAQAGVFPRDAVDAALLAAVAAP